MINLYGSYRKTCKWSEFKENKHERTSLLSQTETPRTTLCRSRPTPPQHVGKVLNTHLMMKHPPWFVDGNKWCDSNADTWDVHCALKPLHGILRRTQIVRSVSKVAWMRTTRMPCDQTHNHAWRVAHQISLRTQQTDRRKCGKRMTVDDVHFEWRFVKPLWSIIAQADSLWMALTPQHNTYFLKAHGSNHHSEEGRTHGVTWHTVLCTTRHGWDGCSATTSSPKPFHFLNASHSAHIWQNMPTLTNWSSSQECTSCDTHVTVPQWQGMGARTDIDNCWWNTPWHSLPHHPPIKTHPLSLSFNHHSTRPGLRPYRDSPHLSLRRLCGWHADRSTHLIVNNKCVRVRKRRKWKGKKKKPFLLMFMREGIFAVRKSHENTWDKERRQNHSTFWFTAKCVKVLNEAVQPRFIPTLMEVPLLLIINDRKMIESLCFKQNCLNLRITFIYSHAAHDAAQFSFGVTKCLQI